VPYSVAIKNYRALVTSPDNADDISKQIVSSQESITKLEQEKEHWLLEYKLLKAMFDKEQTKISTLKEELKKYKSETVMRPPNIDIPPEIVQESTSLNQSPSVEAPIQLLGNVEVFNRGKSGSVDSNQETVIKDYLSNRISEMTKQLQISDSKCINFYQEAHSLYKQIVLAEKNKQKLTNSLGESNKKVESLQDELETTKRSYEEQLGMFSDHLCGMNDKLTSQKDQIDELKTGGVSGTASHNFGIFQLPGRKK